MPPVGIVSWNVLAAPWAAAQWYPATMDPAVLDRHARTERSAAVLADLRPALVCLQETTPPDLADLVDRVGAGWSTHFATNDESFWTNWLGPDTQWEPNGTAIAWDPARVRVDEVGEVRLGDHGNVAAWAQAVIDGRPVLVVSVHLDSDDPDRRRTERPALLALTAGHERVVMAGDYNEDTVSTDLGAPFFAAGFVDVAAACDAREPTHPVARDADDWKALAIIDHVLVRGLAPVAASVHDAGTWELSEWDDRTEALLRRTGSDHLLVAATLDL